MLKLPSPQWFKFLKKTATVLFVAESLAFAGSYFLWYKLNTDRDTRHYYHENYPFVLEGYYKVGEFFDSKKEIARTRQLDLAVWSAQSPKKKEEE